MNAYQNLYQPWRSAFEVWSVLARAQTEFTLRLMGLTAPPSVLRCAAAAPAPRVAAPAVAAVEVSTPEAAPAEETPAEASRAEAPRGEVVPLRFVNEASAPAVAAGTAPEAEALPEAESDAVAAFEVSEELVAAFEALEEPAAAEEAAPAPAVQAEAEASSDLVQAAIQPLLAASVDDEVATSEALASQVAKPRGPVRRAAPAGSRRNKAKRP